MRKKRKFFVALLLAMLMASNMSVLAAEPAIPPSDDVIVIDVTDDGIQLAEGQDVDDNEVIIVHADDNEGVMPLSTVRGYECIHASGAAGTKYIPASGGSSNYGYMQITVREYTGNPIVSTTLYRPDGSYAGQIILNTSNGTTKSVRFNTAVSGTYKVAWGLESGYTCDIDVFLSW